MIGALIGIIITLIIVGVLWWAVEQLLPLIPLPDPFRQIIRVPVSYTHLTLPTILRV